MTDVTCLLAFRCAFLCYALRPCATNLRLSSVRAVAPGSAGMLYAISVHHQILGGCLIWIVGLAVGAVSVVASFALYKDHGAVWREQVAVHSNVDDSCDEL